ncbi:MAG: recombinase family protein [Defluviitaleaceae bacterium]|nr:recombinase family protein [Defluviitaleaceae bacterium]
MKTKRVVCLYRVSTKTQLTNDDIPMQIKACADFIKKQRTWKLEKEYTEKGVSGYHKSAKERDVLVQLQKDAVAGLFDVLLVFMFDRLGRREDETPFVVEWLVSQGIEVWSVSEGQQTFDDHTDKLINYIHYWQSSGESEHTSIRVAEKHNQLVVDGKFRGGCAPYGYRLEYSGEYNRKGYERKKLVIHELEATVVRRVFELSSDINMGSYRVAQILNDEGLTTQRGKKWTVQTILRMLRNPVYKGDYVAGKVRRKRGKPVTSKKETWVHSRELVKELTVVDVALWEQVNANISQRDTRAGATPHDKSGFLLTNVAYCSYCKAKMHPRISRSKRQLKGTGEIAVYSSKYYFCPKKARQGDCDGYVQHGIKRIEAALLDEIYAYLDSIKAMDISRTIMNRKAKLLKGQSETIKPMLQKIATLKKEVARLEEEILKCLAGESAFTQKQLSEAMSDKVSELSAMEHEVKTEKEKTAVAINRLDELTVFRKLVVSWKKEFSRANTETQSALISMVIDHVHIARDSVDIKFKYNHHDIEDIYGGKIIRQGGAPPACPIGSSCDGCWGDRCERGIGSPPLGGNRGGDCCGRRGWGWNPAWRGSSCGCGWGSNRWGWGGYNWLGSVAEIPVSKIVNFTHNTI